MNDFEKQVLARLDAIELAHERVRKLVIELRDKLEKDIKLGLLYAECDIRAIQRLLSKMNR